ncbi:sensor domain-containing protein [Paenibacillus sp. UNC451MF]|uniref:sensor domain-containing protein n=1 Tax=Paenibacillus sp. UNC451MF TaxID=1449063 RepID=UPI00068FBA3C|nr:GGDEF domain-containing phosphodiesterase [Paenibacillus sp. UNC451MF]
MIDSESVNAITSHPLFVFSGDPMLLLDKHGYIQQVNSEYCKLTGYDWLTAGKQLFAIFLEPDISTLFYTQFHRSVEGEPCDMECDLRHRSGHLLTLNLRFIPIRYHQQTFIFLVMRDITEEKITVQLIEHMAYHDTLTGLPNRTLFQIQLTQTIAAAGSELPYAPFAIMLINLDRFQIINESLGLNWGDMLLKQVSERLQRCIKNADLISRLGNYEFVILYKHVDVSIDLTEQSRIIQQQLIAPFVVYDREFVIPGSIGVARYPQDGTDMNSLLRHASKVLTEEKEKSHGWSRSHYDELTSNPLQRLELEYDLRKALEHNEFELYYQPQYDIRDNRLIGMEALIRWRHPKHGMISPAQFIPLAEETGLIVPIGDWVIRTACIQNKRWQDVGLPMVTVSVNLSTRQFQKSDLVGDILQAIRESGLNPQYLELEITESMAMDNVERVIKKLNELKKEGIRISMDDFGTGYSSLHYLKKIPIHKLKIDQSFIRDITMDPDNAAIVSTIIAMANHLKLDVVAEGVETREDLQFLLEQNCGHAQGYYFSKPLTHTEFEQLLHENVLPNS